MVELASHRHTIERDSETGNNNKWPGSTRTKPANSNGALLSLASFEGRRRPPGPVGTGGEFTCDSLASVITGKRAFESMPVDGKRDRSFVRPLASVKSKLMALAEVALKLTVGRKTLQLPAHKPERKRSSSPNDRFLLQNPSRLLLRFVSPIDSQPLSKRLAQRFLEQPLQLPGSVPCVNSSLGQYSAGAIDSTRSRASITWIC